MTFGNVISALLGVVFVYLGASKETSFYWSGYLHSVQSERRGPTIPRWIGMPVFLCIGVALLYNSIRHIL